MKTILVIENKQLLRLRLFNLLKSENFDLLPVSNSIWGLQIAQVHPLDLIICGADELHLEDWNFMGLVRRTMANQNVPILFLIDDPELQLLLIKLGADACVLKTAHESSFLEVVNGLIYSSLIPTV